MAVKQVDEIEFEEKNELTKRLEEMIRDIREIIHALESEPVRRTMANWQREIMEGKRPDITVLDRA